MIRKFLKRGSFLVGVVLAGAVSTLANYFGHNYYKENSLIIDHVNADLQPYGWTGYLGDGSGGCSSGDTGDCAG